jgi:PII-like signaling protein
MKMKINLKIKIVLIFTCVLILGCSNKNENKKTIENKKKTKKKIKENKKSIETDKKTKQNIKTKTIPKNQNEFLSCKDMAPTIQKCFDKDKKIEKLIKECKESMKSGRDAPDNRTAIECIEKHGQNCRPLMQCFMNAENKIKKIKLVETKPVKTIPVKTKRINLYENNLPNCKKMAPIIKKCFDKNKKIKDIISECKNDIQSKKNNPDLKAGIACMEKHNDNCKELTKCIVKFMKKSIVNKR